MMQSETVKNLCVKEIARGGEREREWRNQVPLSVFGLAANETRFQMDMEIKWMPRFIKSTKNKKK